MGASRHTCAECAYMREYCCDYGICMREMGEAFVREFTDTDKPSEAADWALWWTSTNMRDMQGVACEYFRK